MCKQSTRIWSILLVIIMIINMLPVHAFAAETGSKPVDKIVADDNVSLEDLQIVEEIVDRRTEYTKEFRLNNGFRVASVYAYPVHYEENGEWKDIDNTLKLTNARSGNTYTNTAGIWDVSFPQSMTRDKAISITKDGHTLSFQMTGEMHEPDHDFQLEESEIIELPTIPNQPIVSAQETPSAETAAAQAVEAAEVGGAITFYSPVEAATASIEAIDMQQIMEEEQYPEAVMEKLTSRLSYANIYENTDVVFDMTSNMVKESIVLKEYSDTLLGYTYALSTGDMVPVLLESGAIELRDPESDAVVMVMPAPYLIDDAEEICCDVDVSLGGENGAYVLTYTLPQEWLADEERQWPVVLDPAVLPSMSINNIRDVSVHSGGFSNYTDSFLYCGYHAAKSNFLQSWIFLKYLNLPELSAADVIVDAQIRLNFSENNYSEGKPHPTVEVHKVNGTWESETLTWSNKPDHDPTVEDYTNVYYGGGGHRYWDVTDIAREWYETGINTGMMFRLPPETEAQQNLYVQFCSSDHYSYVYYARPLLTIITRNSNGLEGYWDYTSASAGRAGTGSVNQYTGNLVWSRSDIGFGGNRMPVSISHVYNANDNANNDYGMGYGWKTNFNQKVYAWSSAGTGVGYLVWEDGDGTSHYLMEVSSGTFMDEDGLELVATNTGTGNRKYAITDKYGNCTYFDTLGRLTEQINNQQTQSSIQITYTAAGSWLISTITDGAGRVYNFSYNSNNLLNQISYTGTGTDVLSYVNFAYDVNSNLTTVTDKDNKQSTYTYTENHLLQSAQDIDGYKLSYQYTTTAAGQPNRIKTISESDNGKIGTNLAFEYAHNQTKLTEFLGNPTGEKTTWNIQTTQLVQFNNMGNTVSVQDDQGHAQYAQYAINDESDGTATAAADDSNPKANQLKLASKLQNTVASILTDSSFENETLWNSLFNASVSVDSTTAYMGSKSMKIATTSTNTGGGAYSFFSIAHNSTYTFSAYVKVEGGPVCFEVFDLDGTVDSEVVESTNDWTRIELSITNNSRSRINAGVQVSTDCISTIHIDCVQLEEAPTASRYNILQNGDFTNTSSGWSSDAGRTTVTDKAPAEQLDANVYTMVGDPMATNRISQTVNVSGENGDTYVLAGWAKADSVPIKDEREFGLIATFMNDETVVNKYFVRFNDAADSTIEWQYAAAPVVAKGAYDSILIEVAYDYNANTAYFDGIQLFKEEFGNSYAYDEKGNIVSVVDLQKQETTYEYDTFDNLTAEVLPTGARLTYEYDDWHNVTKATSDTNVVYDFTYDEYGNNTSVSITSGNVKLTSSAVYSADGNYLVSTIDAADNTTTYDYDSNTGVLKSVKYPKDTDSTKTTYTYDNMYRLASSVMNNNGTTLSASYEYTNDLLTKITTGSTIYNFSYGDFSLRSSIKVGTQELASYTYDPQDHNLTRLKYGNDDYVNYGYDSHNRLTTQTYEDGDAVTYQYDNNGALATVSDSGSGITTTYFYDFTDRLMKYTEKIGNSFSHVVGYEYDNINNLTALVETINGTKLTSSYEYDDDNRVTRVTSEVVGDSEDSTTNTASETYTYDDFGRLSRRTIGNGTTNVLTKNFGYVGDSSAGKTSGQVSILNMAAQKYSLATTYTYDANGNITTIKSGNQTSKYTYDSANQLVREDNPYAKKTWVWTYDDAGNILSKKEYAYTTGALGSVQSTVNYTYDGTWGDLLTGYNGKTITSDNIGNMTQHGAWKYEWAHGRELQKMTYDVDNDNETANDIEWEFTYNADGIRTKRTNGSTTYNYVYNGSSLSQMTIVTGTGNTAVTKTLNFVYDASGSPMAVVYDNVAYYYVTNLQGDVIAILDSTGAAVVQYSYDAWGRPLTTSGTMSDTLGVHNPLRYRGYVYDDETDLYYLQSRYYDSALGRFINADALTSTGQGLLGNNMFAYCANNPVLYVDYSGRLFGVPSLADFGKIHKRIQYEIAEKEGYTIEVFVDGPRGRGFLDIYNPETNEYYEVKSILQADRKHTKMQMEKYDAAYIRDFRFSDYSIPNPPIRGEKKFSGSFVYSEWTVRYRLSEDGLITYKLELIEEVAAVQAIVAIGAVGISQSAAFAGSGGFGKGLFANTDFRLY